MLRKFKEHPELVNRTVESVLVQEGRAVCVEWASATYPGPGFKDAEAVKFRRRVRGDVGRVFAVRSSPYQVMELLKVHAPKLAKGYWKAHKAGQQSAMDAIVRAANLPQGLTRGAHKSARDAHGAVGKNHKPESLVREPQFNAFAKGQEKLVGFAKAGWYCAAKALGGRVRRNIREDNGKRRTEEIFPKWIRDLARRYPDAGGARVTTTGRQVTVEVFTNVRHAQEALIPGLGDAVEDRARGRVAKALAIGLQKLGRSRFGKKAA